MSEIILPGQEPDEQLSINEKLDKLRDALISHNELGNALAQLAQQHQERIHALEQEVMRLGAEQPQNRAQRRAH